MAIPTVNRRPSGAPHHIAVIVDGNDCQRAISSTPGSLVVHRTQLLCQAMRILPYVSSSWRQRRRSQAVNEVQEFSEQGAWDRDLRQLEGDVAAMAHNLRADLDQP